MNRTLIALAAAAVLAATSGCVVVPARHAGGAVYVAPGYDSPGPGYVWQLHGQFGWGWRHPHRGWHRGWR